MTSLTPFPILAYSKGLYGYLDAWIAPEDSFTLLNNAYVYRGALRARKGSVKLTNMLWQDDAFTPIAGTTAYTGKIEGFPICPGSVTLLSTQDNVKDDGKGILTGNKCSGSIDYDTGIWKVDCDASLTAPFRITYSSLRHSIKGLLSWKGKGKRDEKLLIFDGKRVCVFYGGDTLPLTSVKQLAYVCSGEEVSCEIYMRWPNALYPSSVNVTFGTVIYKADSSGAFTPSGNITALSYDSATSLLKFTFGTKPAKDLAVIFTGEIRGDCFTGADYYFTGINDRGVLYFTNNIDPITLFDGTYLSRPHFSIEEDAYKGFLNQIKTCLGLYVYKNRLLLYGAEIENTKDMNGRDLQMVRWSSITVAGSWVYALNNFVSDVSGYGGFLVPSAEDELMQITSLRDKLILWYSESTSVMAYTGNWFDPFHTAQINNSRSVSSSYGGIEYDDRSTNVGGRGLISCDSVNVNRYDLEIPDEYQDINQENFGRVFSFRDDNDNKTWMLYPSDSYVGETNDTALIYNFLEETWCRYIWNSPRYNCLGSFFVSSDKKWEDFEETWEEVEDNWDAFYYQKNSRSLIGGGYKGGVFLLNEGFQDDGDLPGTFEPVVFSVKTGRWGPFLQKGLKSRFAYLDIYYKNANKKTDAVFTFYADSDTVLSHRQTVVFEATQGSHAFQRVLINVTASLLQLHIESIPDFTVKGEGEVVIYGMILWASPAGRLVP